MICPKCHLGYMLVHAEARGWLKCPLCAFCCKEKPPIILTVPEEEKPSN